MSRWSGRCDFGDTVEIHGGDNILKSKVYLGHNVIPLAFKEPKDLIPYYPYLIAMSFSEDGVGSFYLTNESYVDCEEQDILKWYQDEAVKYVNRCKRRKDEINPEHFKDDFSGEIKTEILRRVIDKNMSLYGIHRPMAEHYRQELCNEMIKAGWNEFKAKTWCFGWRNEILDEEIAKRKSKKK